MNIRANKPLRNYGAHNDQQYSVKELVFLRDIRCGFLPDNHETEYEKCLTRLSSDPEFAVKCLNLALHSRNEDVVIVLLNALKTKREDFARNNFKFVEPLLQEAVTSDDLESIRGILEWRDLAAAQVGFSYLEQKLLRMNKESQDVMIIAAIRDNFDVVRTLYIHGYRIYFDSEDMLSRCTKRLPFLEDETSDVVAHHIDRVRTFRALSSPCYIAMSCKADPVSHSFDFCIRAKLRAKKEPEFRKEYEEVAEKCMNFAVDILDNCRDSKEVEGVLLSEKQLRRALDEGQKEFVAHPYSQLLLYTKWVNGLSWATYGYHQKVMHILFICLFGPFLCAFYLFSPFRDHSRKKDFVRVLRHMDRPINRYILSVASYCCFLSFLLLSILHGIGDHGNQLNADRTWYFNVTTLWIICYIVRDLKESIKYTLKKKRPLNLALLSYNLMMDLIFIIAIALKFYGYRESARIRKKAHFFKSFRQVSSTLIPYNIVPTLVVGANIYGVGASLAFLKLIFLFEIHHRFGPILFCMRHVVWDILTIVGSYFIAVVAFGVGLVSVFGVYTDDSVEHFSDFMSAFKTLFWIIFDPGKEEYTDINEELFQNASSSTNQFENHDKSKNMSRQIGLLIWGFYQVFVVLIMLNLLISLMTTTFSKIQKNSDVEWKFTRAGIWLRYFNDHSALPVPFNIFPSVYSLRFAVQWIKRTYLEKIDKDYQRRKSLNVLVEKKGDRSLFAPILERVFRKRDSESFPLVNRHDLSVLEKEIEIDVSELRKDVRSLRNDLFTLMESERTDTPVKNEGRKVESHILRKPKRRHTISFLTTKLPINVQLPVVNEDEKIPEGHTSSLREESNSKTDEDLIYHLVQTLGLVGGSPLLARRLRRKRESEQFPILSESISYKKMSTSSE